MQLFCPKLRHCFACQTDSCRCKREAPPRGGRVALRGAPPLSLKLTRTHRAGQILFPKVLLGPR